MLQSTFPQIHTEDFSSEVSTVCQHIFASYLNSVLISSASLAEIYEKQILQPTFPQIHTADFSSALICSAFSLVGLKSRPASHWLEDFNGPPLPPPLSSPSQPIIFLSSIMRMPSFFHLGFTLHFAVTLRSLLYTSLFGIFSSFLISGYSLVIHIPEFDIFPYS